jgi:hypothetical protein
VLAGGVGIGLTGGGVGGVYGVPSGWSLPLGVLKGGAAGGIG